MDNKMIAVIAVVVVVAVAGVAAFFVLNKDSGDDYSLPYFDDVDLKVLGNVNGDDRIDKADYDAVKKLIDDKKSAKDNKIADANNDDVLDSKDLEVITKIMEGTTVEIWHVNYHDANGDGVMDTVLTETTIPVTSTIMTGSANNFMVFNLLGIPAGDVVKGACYGSGNDGYIYGPNYLNEKLVEKLNSSSTTIPFEDGKIGSSDIIKEKKVTCLVTDWNRTYIENQAAFEAAGVDVVRISAASVDKEVYTHSLLLMGLIFNVASTSYEIVDLYNDTFDEISSLIKGLDSSKIKGAVASSMNGYVSSGDSDYTAVLEAAGAKFALEGYDFGGSASITVADNLGIFDTRKYTIDNIVHLRTALTYNSTTDELASNWATYANAMSLWEHKYDGQILISGAIPVPARVAYAAYAMYGDDIPALSEEWADSVLASFEDYYFVDVAKAKNHNLILTSYEYSVTVGEGVIVKDLKGNVVESGQKFPYGTTLTAEPETVVSTKQLVATGSELVDGKFDVINNVTVLYMDKEILNKLSTAATEMVKLKDNYYMQKATANAVKPGSVTIVNGTYNVGQTKTIPCEFEYYETEEEAKEAFETYSHMKYMEPSDTKWLLDVGDLKTEHSDVTAYYSESRSTTKLYTGSTLYITGYYKNMVWMYNASNYIGEYTFDSKEYEKSSDVLKEEYHENALAFAKAMIEAMKTALA